MIVGRSNTKWSAEQLNTLVTEETKDLDSDSIDLIGDHDFFRALARVLSHHGVKKANSDSLFDSFLVNLLSNCNLLTATELHENLSEWASKFDSTVTSCPCSSAA